jgi:hypothetical protein
MPFGLCNALATFLRMMNDILRDFFHKFVIVYLDDAYIYSRTHDEHVEHLRLVLQRFKEEGLELRLKKCFFGLQEMNILAIMCPLVEIQFRQRKSRPLQTCQCLKRIRRFSVSCNSATSTPDLFSDLTAPLTGLLRKSQPHTVTLTLACLEAFETLELRPISAPCLMRPEVRSDATFAVATYASSLGIAAFMLQDQGGGLQLVSYWALKPNPTECGNT